MNIKNVYIQKKKRKRDECKYIAVRGEKEKTNCKFSSFKLSRRTQHTLYTVGICFFSFYLSKNKKKKKGGNEMSSSPGTQRRVSCQSLAAHLAIRIEQRFNFQYIFFKKKKKTNLFHYAWLLLFFKGGGGALLQCVTKL